MKTPRAAAAAAALVLLLAPSAFPDQSTLPSRSMTLDQAGASGATMLNCPCPKPPDGYCPGYNPVKHVGLFLKGLKENESLRQKYAAMTPAGWSELNKAGAAPPETITLHFDSRAGVDSFSSFLWQVARAAGADPDRPYADNLGIEWRIRSVLDPYKPSGSCDPSKEPKCSKILEPYWQGGKVIGIYTTIVRVSADKITQTYVRPVTDAGEWAKIGDQFGDKYCNYMLDHKKEVEDAFSELLGNKR